MKINYILFGYLILELDINENDKISIDYIKKYYDLKNHPNVISGKKNEEEQLLVNVLKLILFIISKYFLIIIFCISLIECTLFSKN